MKLTKSHKALLVFTLLLIVIGGFTGSPIPTLYGWLLLAIALLFTVAVFLLKPSGELQGNIVVTVIVTALMLIMGEYVIYWTSPFITFEEKEHNDVFGPPYQYTLFSERLTLYGPHEERRILTPEFDYSFTTNEFGLVEKPLSKIDSSKKIILCIGDSFTEGVGVAPENSWVNTMNKSATCLPDNYYAYNAGIAGSDPLVQIDLVNKLLLEPLKPAMVIMCINTTDMYDLAANRDLIDYPHEGEGFEPVPRIAWLYERSYIARHAMRTVFKYNHILIRESKVYDEYMKAWNIIYTAMKAFNDQLAEQGIDFMMVSLPIEGDLLQNSYTYGRFEEVSAFPHLSILEEFQKTGIVSAENVHDYYYKMDGHCNQKGYELVGNTVANWLCDKHL